jgi:hypothetical protein
MAIANKHIQKFECKKYKRKNKQDPNDPTVTIVGDEVIGNLIKQDMILLLFAIDPHGQWGPITHNFLIGT